MVLLAATRQAFLYRAYPAFGFDRRHSTHPLFHLPNHAVAFQKGHSLSTVVEPFMSANKLKLFLFIPLLAIAGIALGAWELVPQSPGASNTWSEIECEAGTGWRPCIKPAKVCRYDSNNKYVIRSHHCRGASNYPVNCVRWSWGERYLWNGVCRSSMPGFTPGALRRVIYNIPCGQGEVVTDRVYEICGAE